MKLLIIIAVNFFIISCAVNTPVKNESSWLSHSIEAHNCVEGSRNVAGYNQGQPMEAIFPAIPGKIFGTPEPILIAYELLKAGDTFIFDLPYDMSGKAETFSHNSFVITPSHTKVLRVGTFHRYPNYGDSLGGGYFYDEKDNEYVILTYFSTSAKISGTEVQGKEVTTFDIHVPSKGWHWVKINKVSDGRYVGQLFTGDAEDINFCASVRALGT